MPSLSRRQLLSRLGAAAGLALVGKSSAHAAAEFTRAEHLDVPSLGAPGSAVRENPFRFALNTATIRGQNLGIVREIEVTGAAGYDGIEIWVDSLQRYVSEGGNPSDLRRRLGDLGLRVEGAIGFAQWIVDDNDTRTRALEQLRVEMDLLAQVGCERIAAPPAGATRPPKLDLRRVAERFRTVVELGATTGVMPQLELWGFSENLSRLGELLFVAAECGHPSTRILPDPYHLHKGGSDLDGLRLVSGQAIEVFHLNDYPASPGREEIQDADRVYPGDGVAPLADIIRTLHASGGSQVLSLELFHRGYWEQDPLQVARTGLEKMRQVVEEALAA